MFPAAGTAAQSQPTPSFQVYGGYSWLSNSFNGVAEYRKPLSGWNAGAAFQQWHHLRFKLDYSMYRGTNRGDPQHAFVILGGLQYEVTLHRERAYLQGLLGEGGLNGTWFSTANSGYKNGNTGTIASFAEFLGGGLDTPFGAHTALRIEGGVLHTNLDAMRSLPSGQPYHLSGVPNYFGRLSAGLVWIPHPGSAIRRSAPAPFALWSRARPSSKA